MSREKVVLFLIVFNEITITTFKQLDLGAYSYRILPKPKCNSKSIAKIQNTEDNYCLLSVF